MPILQQRTGKVCRVDNPLLANMMRPMFAGKKHVRIYPDNPMWNSMPAELRAHVKACLADAAVKYGCKESDLVVSMVFTGKSMPAISIKKRERIEINEG